jgi:hypothetical protein
MTNIARYRGHPVVDRAGIKIGTFDGYYKAAKPFPRHRPHLLRSPPSIEELTRVMGEDDGPGQP